MPKAPLAEMLRLQRRTLALTAGSAVGYFCLANTAGNYLATYAHIYLGYSHNVILFVGMLGALLSMAFVAFSAILCDRVGRRRIMLVGWDTEPHLRRRY